MPRYIDANALMRNTDKEYIHKYEIALAPTVDAVEVVRCKDCQHFRKTLGRNALEYTECNHFDCDVAEDGFCSWGERKDDAKIH